MVKCKVVLYMLWRHSRGVTV